MPLGKSYGWKSLGLYKLYGPANPGNYREHSEEEESCV